MSCEAKLVEQVGQRFAHRGVVIDDTHERTPACRRISHGPLAVRAGTGAPHHRAERHEPGCVDRRAATARRSLLITTPFVSSCAQRAPMEGRRKDTLVSILATTRPLPWRQPT